MIKSIDIENFRCFKQLSLKDLSTINIVVGDNASGKTALLEAIRLAATGTPQVMLNINQNRNILSFMYPNPTLEVFQSFWSTFFFNGNINNKISFNFVDSLPTPITKTVKIYFDKTKAFTNLPANEGSSGTSNITVINIPNIANITNIIPLKFERHVGGSKTEGLATINFQGQLQLPTLSELGPGTGFYPSFQAPNIQEVAHYYSQLSLSNKEKPIIKILQKIFPFVQDINNLTLMPGQSSLYLSVSNSSIKIPSTLISAGVNKFLSLIIGISSHRRGVSLVDEIDNGFYFKKLPDMWSVLLNLAKECEVQIFASTHSLECLKAVAPLIREDADAFTLIRTIKNDQECTADVFRGDDARAAIESDIEVR